MPTKKSSPLLKTWVHSHEEDTSTETVFRPSSYRFPPSRGRQSLTFKPDGTFTHSGPGPVDAPVESGGTWSSPTDNQITLSSTGTTKNRALQVVSVANDRLVLKRETGNDAK